MESLRKLGYTSLSIPAENVKPLTLLLRTSKGVVENLNESIDELWQPVNLAKPAVSEDGDMAGQVSGFDTLDLKLEGNFNFLQALTKIFSSGLKASLSLDKSKKVKFKLEDPKNNTISIIKLDAFLQDAKLNTAAKSILERLQDGDLYVVTEILKAKSFSVEKGNAIEFKGEASIPVKEIVDASVKTGIGSDRETMIGYNGDHYLTFGFKAFKIYCKGDLERGEQVSFRIREADDIKIYRSEEGYPAHQLDDEIVDLNPIK